MDSRPRVNRVLTRNPRSILTAKRIGIFMMLSRLLTVFTLVVFSALAVPNSPDAAELQQPEGRPILVISGNISATNSDEGAAFDLAMLEALGMESFQTMTPWYDEPVIFEGVPMTVLMDAVGADGETILAVALNDYSSEVPISDFAEHGTLLALKRNGEYMPIRDKGPIFIVYPYDSDDRLHNQIYYARSAWQVHKIIVR